MKNDQPQTRIIGGKFYSLQANGGYALTQGVDKRPQSSLVELSKRNNSLGSPPKAQRSPASLRIRVIGYYVKPLDDCNFCTKYLVDCVRYAEIVADDNWGNLRVAPEQFKVEKEEEEGTEIIIEAI
jgi:hypothetical protein